MARDRYVITVDGKDRVPEGTWIMPKRRGFRFVCCDCASVHTIDFRIRKARAQISIRGDRRRTAAKRRAKKFARVRAALRRK